jgi:NAD(P)-dependent dehydrogenase (short-subunit alcohol dehydrogenase family)
MRLQGKVAIITGAGSGMGRAMALRFSQEGATIVAADWNEATLDGVVNEIKAMGGEVTGIKVNIAAQADAEGLIDQAFATYGKIDVLCNNAGVMDLNQGVGELTDEMWKRVIGINLDGPMYTSRRVVPIMIAQGGGSIINVASAASLGGGAAGAAYTVSKHGLVGLTKNTAWIYAQKGIRCNAIAPGGTQTNIVSSVDMTKFDPEGSKRTGAFTGIIPAMLQSEDIANLALFLASDESRLINGTVIPADGGWRAA